MKKNLLLFFLIPFLLLAQPKDEVRAVWITTAFNLDFPKSSGSENQKREISELLDQLKESNFNTIMLQVRARGDLIYPSKIEPWATSLTGILGKNPGYDPLKYIIEKAHERGIEVHAWWNVYKVYGKGEPLKTKLPHISLSHPEFCKNYKNEIWLDPGIPAVREYLLSLASEMIRNYDIDGLHLDYVRYPDAGFNDEETYKKYGNGENKSDWRRNNITKFVEGVYDSIQTINPYVKLGVAPIGVYKKKSPELRGWDAYNSTFQDPVKWVKDKKVDYVSPQTYWAIKSHNSFIDINRDWKNLLEGRAQIYPGIAAYKTNKEYGNWSADEILAQVDSLREMGLNGMVFFRSENLFQNNMKILKLLKNTRFNYPANIPPMKWMDNAKPLPPAGLTSFKDSDTKFTLYWGKPIETINNSIKYFNIYIDNISPVNINEPKNFVKLRLPANKQNTTIDLSSFPDGKYFICITALDRGNNESSPSNELEIIINHHKNPDSLIKINGQ